MSSARRRQSSPLAPPAGPAPLGVARRGAQPARPTPSALWLALRFPGFARQVFAAAADAADPGAAARAPQPFAVVEGEGARRQVVALDAAAEALGVRRGHSVAAALALAPGLALAARDPARERDALARLAAWAQQFTPTVSLAPPDALLLEVRGSLALFGGVEPLAARVADALAPLGYRAELALAPTPNAALWFARAGIPARILGLDELAGPLGALPLAAAGFDVKPVELLAGVGVHTLRDLARLPRDGLARRYGAALRAELDRALGRAPDPRPAFVPPLRFRGALDLSHETTSCGWIVHAAGRLLAELCGGLAARGAGVRRARLELRHREPPHTEVLLGLLAPSRSVAHLERLLAERVARTPLAGPVRALALEALEVELLGATALELFSARGAAAAGADAPGALIETLRARLGAEAVRGLTLVADHRPERASRGTGLEKIGAEKIGVGVGIVSQDFPRSGAAGAVQVAPPLVAAPRPCWLLDPPRPLPTLRGAPRLRGRRLELLAGPERIESGWWDGDDVARDYYLARAGDGARLWVFRTRGRAAAWFVHGVFA